MSTIKKMKHFGLPIIFRMSATAMIKYKNSIETPKLPNVADYFAIIFVILVNEHCK